MSKLHLKLYKKSPGVTEPPSAEKVNSLLAKFDTDRSGSLTEDEFHSFASDWFDQNGIVFLRHVFLTSFLSMFAMPAIADVVQKETPLVRRLPGGVFKVLFGVGTLAQLFHIVLCQFRPSLRACADAPFSFSVVLHASFYVPSVFKLVAARFPVRA